MVSLKIKCLSTPSLGITCPNGGGPCPSPPCVLSTPSLGITHRSVPRQMVGDVILSTPSLGITSRLLYHLLTRHGRISFQLPLSGSLGHLLLDQSGQSLLAFNSLSRDHVLFERRADAGAVKNAFNSLSRDHGRNMLAANIVNEDIVLSTPSLGIT